MAKKIFKIEKHEVTDKDFRIFGPEEGDQFITIDYDDVDTEAMDSMAEKIVKILNDHWKDPKYSSKSPDLVEFEKWMVDTFLEISAEHGNSETIDEIEIIGKNPMIVSFSLDGGRAGIHKDNSIEITKGGKVTMELCELIEGGDIEHHLKIAIEKKIKGWER